QRISAAEFNRVLGGNHEKQLRQHPPFAFDTDLSLAHSFEQGGLSARRGAVDFVCEENVREHRAFVKFEFLVALVENGDAEDVRWEQIGRELNAFELGVYGPGKRLGQRRL